MNYVFGKQRKKKRKERKRKIHQRPSNPHPPPSEGQKSNRAIGNWTMGSRTLAALMRYLPSPLGVNLCFPLRRSSSAHGLWRASNKTGIKSSIQLDTIQDPQRMPPTWYGLYPLWLSMRNPRKRYPDMETIDMCLIVWEARWRQFSLKIC